MFKQSEISAKKFGEILDSLSEGVCTVDKSWKFTSFNRAARNITRYSGQEILSMSFNDIFRCEICECRLLLAGVMKNEEAIQDVTTSIVTKNRKHLRVKLNATPLKSETGEIDGMVVTFRADQSIRIAQRNSSDGYVFGDIVSKNHKILRILNTLPNVAESDSTVLISGPSGTGKDLLAREIHNLSPRKNNPFIVVNCGALPDNLLESELFGYKKGAFTDAKQDKPGRFASAEGGTLFLDEIGDISPAMQVKLLRAIQERQYQPLGGIEQLDANVRIITATNQNITEMVEQGQYRSDLYYRINIIELALPPLAERSEDIPLLVEHFIEQFNIKTGRSIMRISQQAMRRLLQYDYPGNIRELQNIIERAYILCPEDEIQEQCLPPKLLDSNESVISSEKHRIVNLRALSKDEEQKFIIKTLKECNGNRKETAKQIGIHPSTLWRKIKRYSIE